MTADISYLHALLSLAAVLGLLLAAGSITSWFRGRAVAGGPHARLSIIEQRQLDPRTRLVLVRCNRTEHLLMIAPNGAQTLDRTVLDADRAGAGP